MLNIGFDKVRSALNALQDERGATAVEFAVIAPVFMMLVFGVIVYGIYFAGLIAVTNAASEGARATVAGLSDTERQSLAMTAATNAFANYAPFLSQANFSVTAQTNSTNAKLYQVSATYDFSQFGLSGLGAIVPMPAQKPTVTVSVAEVGSF